MRIDSIRVIHVALPLLVPERFGERQLDRRESVLVEMRSAGLVGWGEASPGSAPADGPEWAGGAFLCLTQWFAPALVGQDVTSGESLQDRLRHVTGNNAARAALDCAWWNLESQRQAVRLPVLLKATRTTLPAAIGLPVRSSIDELLADIRLALEAGYLSIGLKFRPGWGLEMVRAVRSVHPVVPMWIDCDGLCRLEQREMFFRLDDFLLESIEQPLPADDLVGHAMLQEAIRTPITLDQSVTSLERAEQALELGSCRRLRIDPARVGGITPAVAIAVACRASGTAALVGCAAATSVGWGSALALAATVPLLGRIDVPSDLAPAGAPWLRLSPGGPATPEVAVSSDGLNATRAPAELRSEFVVAEQLL